MTMAFTSQWINILFIHLRLITEPLIDWVPRQLRTLSLGLNQHWVVSRDNITDEETDCREWRTWLDSTKWLDRAFFFVSAVLLSTIILLFLLSSAVSLSYFNLAVPMRKCLGKHSCMSCQFSMPYWMELALFGHHYSFVVTCLLSNNWTTNYTTIKDDELLDGLSWVTDVTGRAQVTFDV